ncbi:hypothetical protein HZS_1594 [Henneguya salminicola]|nr:hypothetical protein HZS_1594 [Henneguya salminicola]
MTLKIVLNELISPSISECSDYLYQKSFEPQNFRSIKILGLIKSYLIFLKKNYIKTLKRILLL